MSVYRRKGEETYSYDFVLKRRRFSGSTGCVERRQAENYENDIARPAAQRALDAEAAASKVRSGEARLSIGEAVAVYWEESGKHHAGKAHTERDLTAMVAWFGAEKAMEDIADADVAAWVARRRGDRRPQPARAARNAKKPRAPAELISNATVNRTTSSRLRALFGYFKRAWKRKFPNEPDWGAHRLKEAEPRAREIPQAVRRALIDGVPSGYREVVEFAEASGKRQAECLLRWSDIDEAANLIHVRQKGGGTHSFPITLAMRLILNRCRGHHPVWVFTYVAQKRGGKGGHLRLGKRYPVTLPGLRSVFNRRAKKMGLARAFHGLRHTRAMTLLRHTGNLKMAQDQLGHSDIKTTAKFYGHVLKDDLRAGLDAADRAERALLPVPDSDREQEEQG